MVNKRNTILFISLFVLVTLFLGSIFRKVDFTYLKSKYDEKTNQSESFDNRNSEPISEYSYSVTFDANDFEDIYLQGNAIQKDGITIKGDNFVTPQSDGIFSSYEQVATSLLISNDNSWDSIDSISFDILFSLNDMFNKKDDVRLLNKELYLSWPLTVDVSSKEASINSDLEFSYINVFDYKTSSLEYVSSMGEFLTNIVSLLSQDQIQTLKSLNDSFVVSSDFTYSSHAKSISPKIISNKDDGFQKTCYVYFLTVSGTKDHFGRGNNLFSNQITKFVNLELNQKAYLNSVWTVKELENKAKALTGFDTQIYNAYDILIPDDAVLFDAINDSLDDGSIDIKLLLTSKFESYYVPITFNESAFFIGSPREMECCTPNQGKEYWEIDEALRSYNVMLPRWLNDLNNYDIKTFSYVLYYGLNYSVIKYLFDGTESKTACDWGTGCDEWIRYEPLPMLETSYDEQVAVPLNSIARGGDPSFNACNTDNGMEPGGKPYVSFIPNVYPAWPVAAYQSGDLMGYNGGDNSDPLSETAINTRSAKLSTKDVILNLEKSNLLPEPRKLWSVVPNCPAQTFIPIVVKDSNSYPNAGEVNNDGYYACYSFQNCQKLIFKETAPGQNSELTIQFPDIDQVARPVQAKLTYSYNIVNRIATYSNIIEATNAINADIANQLAIGVQSPTSGGIKPGSTYADVESAIWRNITTYGWGEFESSIVPENIKVTFYDDPQKTNEVSRDTALKYGTSNPNTIYYSFETKNPNVLLTPGTVESLAPFTIQDTTAIDYSPSESEISAGDACVDSLTSANYNTWTPSTTMGTIKNEINNNQSYACLSKFGLSDISNLLTLNFYQDQEGTLSYADSDQVGEISIDDPKVIYYRYDLTSTLNWWETYSMPMQSFILKPGDQSIYLPGNETRVVNGIQNELKTLASINKQLTNDQVMKSVQKHSKDLVIPPAAENIGINYYDQNGMIQTEIDPTEFFSDEQTFQFDIYLATPMEGYAYWNDMPKLSITIDWNSIYTIVANTSTVTPFMPSYFETETITDVNGDEMQVANDSWTYTDVMIGIGLAFEELFEPEDVKYVDEHSLSITDNGMAVDEYQKLLPGEHKIEYKYESSIYNCSWYDVGSACHPIDGVTIQGFDGVSNVFVIDVYEVVWLDPAVVNAANLRIASQISNEIDTNKDDKVDEGTSVTYYRITRIIETILEEEDAFESASNHFKVEVRAVFNNNIGHPEFFMIDESNEGRVVDPQITGFQYRIVDDPTPTSKELWFTDPSAYDYYTTWTGYNYHPPVSEGTIFGNGVLYWLIVGSFVALIILGICAASFLMRKRKIERGELIDANYTPPVSRKKNKKQSK